jgi:transcriptional regulator with GAF, ATPase, and Fis domain
VDASQRELRYLRLVRDLSQRLASEEDPSRLLRLILDAAIDITAAERGFLVRVLGRRPSGAPRLHVDVVRGFDRTALSGSAGALSQTVVQRVLERGDRGLVTTAEDDQDVLDASSVVQRKVLAIICVPLRLRGETKGVLYLDHRFREDAFGEEDLPLLRSFADQAAVALETAELRDDHSGVAPALREAIETVEAARSQEESGGEPAVEQFGRLVGSSGAMCALYDEVERAARSEAPLLLLGETGAGKRLVAEEIHRHGPRAREPFLSVACGGDPAAVEAELLGHRRGARPWAHQDRRGAVVLAGRGTLYLSEVDALAPALQAALVEVLQTGRVRAPGGEPVSVACRILAGSARDVRAEAAGGRFRQDLLYRLDVARVIVPPLRQRTEDLPLLIRHLLHRCDPRRSSLRLSPKAQQVLASYAWPGNVRELENEVRRLAELGGKLSARQLSPEIVEGRGGGGTQVAFAGKSLDEALVEVERRMVQEALEACGGNKAQTARRLGVPRSTLYHLLQRHGLV